MLKSLLTKAYWSRSCTVEPAYGWFLAKLKASVDEARLKHGADEVGSRLRDATPGFVKPSEIVDDNLADCQLSSEHLPHLAVLPPCRWLYFVLRLAEGARQLAMANWLGWKPTTARAERPCGAT